MSLVQPAGLEPATSSMSTRRSPTELRLHLRRRFSAYEDHMIPDGQMEKLTGDRRIHMSGPSARPARSHRENR